jgi:hypothetical protein
MRPQLRYSLHRPVIRPSIPGSACSHIYADILPPEAIRHTINFIGLGGIGSPTLYMLRKMGFTSFVLWDDDLVDFTNDEVALRLAKQAVAEFVKEDEQIDVHARQKVSSLKRNVIEGSPEWDILYKKYYEEERNRRGKG